MKIVLLVIILKICIGWCLFENIRENRFNKIKINGFIVLNLNFYVLFKDFKLDFYWYVFMCFNILWF